MKPQVYEVWPPTDDTYPRLNTRHPRNRGTRWREFLEYCETGQPRSMATTDLFINEGSLRIDVLWYGARHAAISERMRLEIEKSLDGGVRFLPVQVNSRPFWILHAPTVSGALDNERTLWGRRPDGSISTLDHPVWVEEVVRDQTFFRTPEASRLWATQAVLEAYSASSFHGFRFDRRGEVT